MQNSVVLKESGQQILESHKEFQNLPESGIWNKESGHKVLKTVQSWCYDNSDYDRRRRWLFKSTLSLDVFLYFSFFIFHLSVGYSCKHYFPVFKLKLWHQEGSKFFFNIIFNFFSLQE